MELNNMPKAVDEPASGDANSTFSPVSASGSKCPEANLAGTRGAAAAAAAFATPVVAATAAAAWNEDYWAGLNRGRSAYERAYEDSPASPGPVVNELGLTEADMMILTVKEFNRHAKKSGLPKAVIKRVKENRRTVKNRGYAAVCRTKYLARKAQLQRDILSLDAELRKWTVQGPTLVQKMRSQLAMERSLNRRKGERDEEEIELAEEILAKLEEVIADLV